MFALEGDTLYSAVDRKPKRSSNLRRIENARARPEVTILVDHHEEDWGGFWWIRLRGRGRVLDDGEERERALTLLKEKYPQYRTEPPDGPVLAVDVTDVSEWRVEVRLAAPEEPAERWQQRTETAPPKELVSREPKRGSLLACSLLGESLEGGAQCARVDNRHAFGTTAALLDRTEEPGVSGVPRTIDRGEYEPATEPGDRRSAA